MKIHNHGKVHQYRICGYKVKKLQSFTYQFSTHDPYSPKCGPILLKFSTKVKNYQTKSVLEQYLKNSKFYRNRTNPKFALLVMGLMPCFPLQVAKIEKTKSLPKKTKAIRLTKYVKTTALLLSLFWEK